MTTVVASTGVGSLTRYLEWGPILAGAFTTAAILFVLLTFGSGLGISAVSPWPNSGMSATTLAIIGGLWAVSSNIFAFGVGGYLAGRLRTQWADTSESEHHFRDGAHGFVVWAVAIVIGAMIAASTAAGAARITAQAGAAAAGAAAATAAATIDPRDLGVDLLLRPAPGGAAAPAAAAPQPAMTEDDRKALTRTVAIALRDGSLQPRDRTYLAQIVAQRTGMPQADAEKRVDEMYTEVKAAEAKAREAADKARKATALAAFLAAATFALACLAACLAAAAGGRHRDERTAVTFLGARRFW